MSKESQSSENRVTELNLPNFMSPYRLAKFESVLRGKTIPPQKLYGYLRQGYLKGSENSTGKIQISQDEAIRYLLTQV